MVAFSTRPRVAIWIRKRKEGIPFSGMWVGNCTCGKEWPFWFFGATLGYGLEHLRRHGCGTNDARRGQEMSTV